MKYQKKGSPSGRSRAHRLPVLRRRLQLGEGLPGGRWRRREDDAHRLHRAGEMLNCRSSGCSTGCPSTEGWRRRSLVAAGEALEAVLALGVCLRDALDAAAGDHHVDARLQRRLLCRLRIASTCPSTPRGRPPQTARSSASDATRGTTIHRRQCQVLISSPFPTTRTIHQIGDWTYALPARPAGPSPVADQRRASPGDGHDEERRGGRPPADHRRPDGAAGGRVLPRARLPRGAGSWIRSRRTSRALSREEGASRTSRGWGPSIARTMQEFLETGDGAAPAPQPGGARSP